MKKYFVLLTCIAAIALSSCTIPANPSVNIKNQSGRLACVMTGTVPAGSSTLNLYEYEIMQAGSEMFGSMAFPKSDAYLSIQVCKAGVSGLTDPNDFFNSAYRDADLCKDYKADQTFTDDNTITIIIQADGNHTVQMN